MGISIIQLCIVECLCIYIYIYIYNIYIYIYIIYIYYTYNSQLCIVVYIVYIPTYMLLVFIATPAIVTWFIVHNMDNKLYIIIKVIKEPELLIVVAL